MDTATRPTDGGEDSFPSAVNRALEANFKKRVPNYFEGSGREHDDLMRCQDCGRLVTYDTIMRTGVTPCCGTRKVRQVQHLRFFEWLKVRLGILDFPRRREFLKEFSRVRGSLRTTPREDQP